MPINVVKAPSDYLSFTKKIGKISTLKEAKLLECSLDRLWDNGIFTASELQRLDSRIMAKVFILHLNSLKGN